jgi:molybdate/tungstate transport system substrate-binding protein
MTLARRSFVVAVALALLAGCGGNDAGSKNVGENALPTAATDPNAVVIAHAGSLTGLLEKSMPTELAKDGIAIHGVSASSLAIAQQIKQGLVADLYASADANTNQVLMGSANGDKVPWFATFASNSVVVAYSSIGKHAKDFDRAKNRKTSWYAPLVKRGVRLGRTDPDSDPLGYYSLMVCQLAGLDAKNKGLKKRILGDDRNPDQVKSGDPTQLLLNGELDAAFMYRTSALASGLSFVELPKRINLSDANQTKSYARAKFTNSDRMTYTGGVIVYSIAPVAGGAHADEALRVIEYLLSPDGRALARSLGFLSTPVLAAGDVAAIPASIAKLVKGHYPVS